MRIAFAVLVAGMTFTAQADGIYKWVGEDGVVHFSSHPPQSEQVEVVKEPKSERYKRWQDEQTALSAVQQAATASKAETKPAAIAKKPQPAAQKPARAELAARAQRCHNARSTLQELHAHPRVREVDASGNMRVLGENERQLRIQSSQRLIQENC